MQLKNFQNELKSSYMGGGTGAVISGVVWLAAALVASKGDITKGFYVLFFGGMLIFPVSKLVLKYIFKKPLESKENPGGLIVIETIFPMIIGFFTAWLFIPFKPEFTFPISALAVGAHYFGFRTAYGDWTYWILATVICLLGFSTLFMQIPSVVQLPYWIAIVEFIFGFWFMFKNRA